jgi:hypothetical protein
MGVFQFAKTVSALPGTLVADTIYAVRIGEGFDLFVSDTTGTVAHKIDRQGRSATEDVTVAAADVTASTGETIVLTGATTTVTLPVSPSAGDWVTVSDVSGNTDNIIARNGSNIMALTEDLTLDTAYCKFRLIYTDATNGWVLA